MSQWRIIRGDVEASLREMGAAMFSACFCDPPYGLSFLGNRWDYDVPSVDVWREVFRVLRPGAPLLSFGGTRTVHRMTVNIEDAGFDIEDSIAWLHGQGKPATKHRLKPAHEPVVLARKPYPGTLALNLRTWGTGSLAIEASRIATDWSDRPESWKRSGHSKNPGANSMFGSGGKGINCHPAGRWPANVILDEEAGALLDKQTGILHTHGGDIRKDHASMGYNGGIGSSRHVYADKGGASRFFYCAKASKSERNGNTHPTVKPIALTTYLARLVLPVTPAAILVPYSGSGSEMLGALAAGWAQVIGIEQKAEYIEIAERRLAA